MIFHVLRHSALDTLATVRQYTADEPPLPAGWVRCSPADHDAWIQAEIAAGWVPVVSTPVEFVPDSVTARQLFPVLRRTHGITPEAIEAAINNPAVIADADDRADALIEFRRAYIIERSNPLIALLAGVFGLTKTQIDDAFIAAEKR